MWKNKVNATFDYWNFEGKCVREKKWKKKTKKNKKIYIQNQ